jgi:negative regulator of sigma E activity
MNTKRWSVVLVISILSIAVTACGGILSVNTATGEEVEVNNVKILTVGSNPADFFADVSGLLPDGCSQIGENVQEVNNNTIEVTLYSTGLYDDCSFLNPTPFKEKVSLDVRGVPAGTYFVEVNGVIARGSMTKE